VDLLQFII